MCLTSFKIQNLENILFAMFNGSPYYQSFSGSLKIHCIEVPTNLLYIYIIRSILKINHILILHVFQQLLKSNINLYSNKNLIRLSMACFKYMFFKIILICGVLNM